MNFRKLSNIFIIIVILNISAIQAIAADWNVPLFISSGNARTSISLGIAAGATDGYDKGFDAPIPFVGESLVALFRHPEWNVTVAKERTDTFYRDIRGTLPQTFNFEITSSGAPVTVKWDRSILQKKIAFLLNDSARSKSIDMKAEGSYTFEATGTVSLNVTVDSEDSTPPAAPNGLALDVKMSSIFLTWQPNQETDLAGYKLHFTKENGGFGRTIDIGNSTNYNLFDLINDVPYSIAVSAYDTSGNESTVTSQVTTINSGTSIIPGAGDGDLDGDGKISIIDAILTLRMSYGLDPVTSSGLAHGDMDSDGVIRLADALFILRRVAGTI